MKYFLLKSTIFFCVKQKICGSSEMKLLRYHFANISNLPNINCALSFISFFFLYRKRLNTGRFPIVKFKHHFCFSKVKRIYNFFIYKPFLFLLFNFSDKNQCCPIVHKFFKLFFSGLVRWFVLIEWKCFRLKCFNYF